MKITALSICILFSLLNIALAQEPEKPDKEVTRLDAFPEFQGGDAALMKFIMKNIKYPKEARQKGTQGKVLATFVIGTDGSLEQIKLLEDVGDGCGEEALRLIKLMDEKKLWTPGKKDGQNVAVQFNLPINFKLDNDSDKSDDEVALAFALYLKSVDQGKAAYKAKDYKQATTYYDKALEHYPNDKEVHYMKGMCAFGLKDMSAACENWNIAMNFGHKKAAKKVKQQCKTD